MCGLRWARRKRGLNCERRIAVSKSRVYERSLSPVRPCTSSDSGRRTATKRSKEPPFAVREDLFNRPKKSCITGILINRLFKKDAISTGSSILNNILKMGHNLYE